MKPSLSSHLRSYLVPVLCLLLLSSCTKKVEYPPVYLKPITRSLLYPDPTVSLVSQTHQQLIVSQVDRSNYWEEEHFDTYPFLIFGRSKSVADIERMDVHYTSTEFNIDFDLDVIYGNWGQADRFQVIITDHNGDTLNEVDFYSSMDGGRLGYSGLTDTLPKLALWDTTLHDLYFAKNGTDTFYFQENRGMVAFEVNGTRWRLK